MKLFIGADHRGYQMKESLKVWLIGQRHDVTDCGAARYDPADDYPDFAFAVGESVSKNPESRGIVICGSGVGVTVAANKVKGVRCSNATSVEEVKLGREDDDLNVLALSSNYMGQSVMQNFIDVFIHTRFLGDARHTRRLDKIKTRESVIPALRKDSG